MAAHGLKDESEFSCLVGAGQDQVDDKLSLHHVNVRQCLRSCNTMCRSSLNGTIVLACCATVFP